MEMNTYTLCLFLVSLSLCVLPQFMTKIKAIKTIYPYITTFVAGFMLSVILLDFIPHLTTGGCSHNAISKEEGNEEGSHEDHDHTHKDHDDAHKNHKHSHPEKLGLFTSGIAFIFLIGIDSLVLSHSHCDNAHAIHDHSQHNHDKFGSCNTEALKYSTSFAQAIILVFALSLHSFFEGLGMDNSSASYRSVMFFHKAIESFTLGVAISTAKTLKLPYALILSIFYSILTPLGILTVKGVSKLKGNTKIIDICNGLALGSTLFIVCIEMIPPMFHSKGTFKEDAIKISCLVIGFLLTSFIISKNH